MTPETTGTTGTTRTTGIGGHGGLFLTSVLVATVLAVATLPAAQSQAPGSATRRFGLDDFSKVVRVSDPQISPDGKSIAVVISKANLDENRYEPDLVVVDVASGSQRKLVTGMLGVTGPRWSPDGQALAFMANAGPPPALQIWTVPAGGGKPKSLTSAPRGVQQMVWSPDSTTLAFAAQDEPETQPGFERFNRSFEVTPNTNYTMTAALPPTHLWIVRAAGGEAKRLTSGPQSLPISRPPGPPASGLIWTKGGDSIMFSRGGGGGGRGGMQLIKVADGTIQPMTGVSGTHPQIAPVGDALLSMNAGNVNVWPGPGENARNLTQAIDRNLARALWLPDSKSFIVGGNDSERVSLWVQPLEGPARKLDLGDLSPASSFYVDMNVSKTGAITFSATSPTRPAELYYMPSVDGPVRRLTDVNGELASIPLGKTDTIAWKFDNHGENGMLTYPPDFDPSKKYPLVLLVHGGPRAASMRTFSPAAQLMAAKGWLVFQPNYRGSDNLGTAYSNAIRNDAGEGPGKDVMAGIEELKKRGIVDTDRMGVSGWSYGGYMTTWMLGHYDVWKAGVTGASVTSQLDQYNLSDGAGGGRGNNSPWTNADVMERMRQQSPITNAHKIKAPTLILHNTGDYRVTVTQSYNLYHALLDAGVTTQFIAYPINGHNAVDPVHQRDVQRRWLEWFEKYLK